MSWDALPSFASLSQSVKNGLSKSIFYVKNHPNLSQFFFSLKNTNLEAHFLLLAFFDKINFQITFCFLKWCLIFDSSPLHSVSAYRNSAYTFRPWTVSTAKIQFIKWKLKYCSSYWNWLQFPNSKKNSFRGKYTSKYGM